MASPLTPPTGQPLFTLPPVPQLPQAFIVKFPNEATAYNARWQLWRDQATDAIRNYIRQITNTN